jgi:hypothetical protein
MTLVPFVAPQLSADQERRWREFNERALDAHYTQDPAWAGVERRGAGQKERCPYFFWCEREGEVCLTALGVRRRLPIPHKVFWQFDHGPTTLTPGDLDEWLTWLLPTMKHEAARLMVQPASRLDETGDQMETVLDAHGLVRRRTEGVWATLMVDLTRTEEELMASLRSRYRSRIRQSSRLGIEVTADEGPAAVEALTTLDDEMSARTGVRPYGGELVEAICRKWCRSGEGGTALVARHQGELLAAILVVGYRSTAEMFMMPASRRLGNVSTSHLLLWEAMRWAMAHGYAEFDLGGYGASAGPGDPLGGVNEFKRGFAPGQQVRKYVAVHELVNSPWIVSAARAARREQARRRVRHDPTDGRTSRQP